MSLQLIIDKAIQNPRRSLFLIDGLGALLSAFLLGVVLVRLESSFGMPSQTLYLLASIPCVFIIYDLVCYFQIAKNWAILLRTIATMNLIYCIISIAMIISHYQELTTLGWIYFLLEIVIIILLVVIEFKTATQLKQD